MAGSELAAVTAPTRPWHALPAEDALAATNSGPQGLRGQEAARRLAQAGPNTLTSPGRRESVLEELLESLREPLQLLLVVVGVLSALWGELRDAAAIFAIILAVAAVETATELRARRALDALRALTAPTARAVRDGELVQLPARDLVVGDVVALEAGDLVPADCRILGASGLAVDESALTGEAQAVLKGPRPVTADAPLDAHSSLVYAGTAVVAGEGRCLVVATGLATELGRLGRLVATEAEPPTPLQRTTAQLARVILVAAVAVSVLVPLLGLARGQPLRPMLLAGLTLAFATVPEELPILVTVLLAVGGQRLARRGALLRRLRAGETLGAVTVVVTDKTGTLTENRLELARLDGDRARVLRVALGCHSLREQDGRLVGDPVEAALVQAAHAEGVRLEGTPLALFPFDPERKRMSRAWQTPGGVWVGVKGAPERVLEVCALPEAEALRLGRLVGRLAEQGLRVLAFAERHAAAVPAGADQAERDLVFVGLAAMADPLRPGVPEAVAALSGAGVGTMLVTGDHPRTAAAVARQAGLQPGGVLLGGAEVAALEDRVLAARLHDWGVVARATPADKLRIVRVLQAQGEVVAVTGDGVNDAPALTAANVGVAMGRRGTELAREAADLVLTDDAYPTVSAAVAGGRAIAAQLRRAVAFYLGAKLALVVVMALPLALGLPAPFEPVHIVLLELFMDLGASVAFVAEPAAPGAMHRPPRDPARRFLDRAETAAILTAALALFAGVVAAFLVIRARDGAAAGSAAALTTWLLAHVGVAWTLRTQPGLPLRANLAFPGWAAAAIAVGAALGASGLAGLVDLVALPASAWLVVLASVAGSVALAALGRVALRLGGRL